jgi:nicotinate-nucleotide adenylyltransferase
VAKLGLLGGTFNPPHVGHLICAQEALVQLGLDRVLLVPASKPPHKEVVDDPGPQVRLELCRLAVEGDERLGVCDHEVLRPGPSYTVDTLRAIHAADPGDDLTFIVGGDVAQGLPTWREPAEVLRLARLAVAERAGAKRQDVLERVQQVPGGRERVSFFDMPRVDLSSSLVRRHAAARRPIRYLVPDAVAAYVERHGVYAPTPAGTQTTR